LWSQKLKDIHEWLVEIGIAPPQTTGGSQPSTLNPQLPTNIATYHEACHLCHGQKITQQPRAVLKSIPGLKVVELPESTWCCGSAGIYNITQPEMSHQLLERKLDNIAKTGAKIVASANPGCSVQLEAGARERGEALEIVHPITLLARAYRKGGDHS
jgi:glycolate oxidase iron-sulfur subunit